MIDTLDKFIDRCLIDEYATKDKKGTYHLDVDNLPANELSRFVDEVMKSDCNAREEMLIAMQKMLNARLVKKEIEDGDFFNDDTVHEQLKADGHPYA